MPDPAAGGSVAAVFPSSTVRRSSTTSAHLSDSNRYAHADTDEHGDRNRDADRSTHATPTKPHADGPVHEHPT